MIHCTCESTSSMGNHKMAQLSLIGEVRQEITTDMINNYSQSYDKLRRVYNAIKGFRVSTYTCTM